MSAAKLLELQEAWDDYHNARSRLMKIVQSVHLSGPPRKRESKGPSFEVVEREAK